MKLLAGAVLASVLLLGVVSYGGGAVRRCVTGQASGFATIEKDPLFLVGTIPGTFTADGRFFSSRYSCKGLPAAVRRVSLGLYEVRFPGLAVRAASVSAVSDEGITASLWPLGNGIVRVALRGPLGGADVATRRDVPFSVIVY